MGGSCTLFQPESYRMSPGSRSRWAFRRPPMRFGAGLLERRIGAPGRGLNALGMRFLTVRDHQTKRLLEQMGVRAAYRGDRPSGVPARVPPPPQPCSSGRGSERSGNKKKKSRRRSGGGTCTHAYLAHRADFIRGLVRRRCPVCGDGAPRHSRGSPSDRGDGTFSNTPAAVCPITR